MQIYGQNILNLDFVNNLAMVNGEDYAVNRNLTPDRQNVFDTYGGPIAFSRASGASSSPGTMVDQTGKVTYAANNLLTYSEFPNGLTDAPTRGGLVTATTFSGLNSNTGLAFGYDGVTGAYAYKSGNFNSIQCTFSVYVRMDDGNAPSFGSASAPAATNDFAIVIGGQTPAPNSFIIQNLGGGLYRVSGSAVAGAVGNTGIVKYTSNSNRTFKFSGYQLEQVTYQTQPGAYILTTSAVVYGPRLDYDPVTLAPKGLLIEEARTNVCIYSDQFNNPAWPKTNATITANATTSPDGTLTADTLTDNATNSRHSINQNPTISASATYTVSVYLKAGTGRYFTLSVSAVTAGSTYYAARYDLQTGTVTDTASSSGATYTASSITSIGSGWYRCVLTGVLSTFTDAVIMMSGSINSTGFGDRGAEIYTGSGLTWYLWGAQVEAGAFATSYIPTVASTLTRSIDVCSVSGTNFANFYNPTQGTVITAAQLKNTAASTVRSYPGILQRASDNRSALAYYDRAVIITQIPAIKTGTTPGYTQGPFKIGYAYTGAGSAITTTYNGVVTAQAFTADMSSATQILLSGTTVGSVTYSGWITSLQYYPYRLSDAQLQSLTA